MAEEKTHSYGCCQGHCLDLALVARIDPPSGSGGNDGDKNCRAASLETLLKRAMLVTVMAMAEEKTPLLLPLPRALSPPRPTGET